MNGNHPEIVIKARRVGYEYDPLIIAEIGINHEGSLQTAFEMVDAAKIAGAEIIKHQTHIVQDEMSAAAKEIMPGNADVSIYELMARCALNEEDERSLKEYVESKGMIFISTPFSRAAADRLERMDVPAYKIGSGECNNYPLVEHIAQFGKPMIVSTGMNTIESVAVTVEILERHKVPYALLHTTNLYPTPPQLVRLGAMVQLADRFPRAVVGLSDHTTDNLACFGAVALGAAVLERHFTDRMDRPGPDIVCSMDPVACKELIEGCQIIRLERGGAKAPAAEEQVTIDFAFASIVSICDIESGEMFSPENIWVKRPGLGGIPAKDYDKVLRCKSSRYIPADTHLSEADII